MQVLALGIALQRVAKALQRLVFPSLGQQVLRVLNGPLPGFLTGTGLGFCLLACNPLPLQPFAFLAFALRSQTRDFGLDRFQRRMQLPALGINLDGGAQPLERRLFLSLREQLARFEHRLLRRRFARAGFGFGLLARDPLPLQPFALRLQKPYLCLDRLERRVQVLALGITLQRRVEAAQRLIFLSLRQQLSRVLNGLRSRGSAGAGFGFGFLARDPLVFLPLLLGLEFFNRLAHHRDLEVKIGAIGISAFDRQQDLRAPLPDSGSEDAPMKA